LPLQFRPVLLVPHFQLAILVRTISRMPTHGCYTGKLASGGVRPQQAGEALCGTGMAVRATEDELLVTCSRILLLAILPELLLASSSGDHAPEVLLSATTPTTCSCRWPPLEFLLQLRSLFAPSCIFTKVCIFFPVECVGSTRFMDGIFHSIKSCCVHRQYM
jgi:hypothetical protein